VTGKPVRNENDIIKKALGFPRKVSGQVRGIVQTIPSPMDHKQGAIKYLWIHIGSTEERDAVPGSNHNGLQEMQLDDWYNVVDETAALGVDTLIITAGNCLNGHPEVWDICRWAQDQHNMTIGIHIGPRCFDESQVEQLASLNRQRTRIFVDGGDANCLPQVSALGIHVFAADGLEDGATQPYCDLPSSMCCIDGSGRMYACGLVIGQREFDYGSSKEKRVDQALADQSLPHCIPENTSTAARRCNGCPPLLDRKIRGEQCCH
jgi:hypothetical protein